MGTDGIELLKQSANHSWEAMMVAFFCIAVVGLLVWLIHHWSKQAFVREERMAKRIDDLEGFTRNTLLDALRDNSTALNQLTAALHGRLCLLRADEQAPILQAVAARVVETAQRKP